MKTSTSIEMAGSRLYCSVFGHQYQVSKNVTEYIKEYTCNCCKKELTTKGNGKLTELTAKYKEINRILEHIYNKRVLRMQQRMSHLHHLNLEATSAQI